MFQITHEQGRDMLALRFKYNSAKHETLVKSFENPLVTGVPADGLLAEVFIPVSKWNADLIRKSCVPNAMTPAAKNRLNALDLPVNRPGAAIRDTAPVITDWKFYRVPFKHQVIAFKFAVDNPYSALLLDMGLGKTFVAVNVLDYFRIVKGSKHPSLVVIPLSSFETWEREFKECGSDARVVSVLGSRARKLELLAGPGDVYLITYETLKGMVDAVKARTWEYLVLDESTKIKNSVAERSKAVCAVRDKANRRMILTGYPITQSYVDLFGQYKFLDPSVYGTSRHHFKSRYCVMGGYNDKQVMGYANVKELVERMFSRAIRFTKDECLDLPPKVYQTYKFDLDPEERKAYDELKKQLVLQFKESKGGVAFTHEVSATNALVAGLRLVQICTGYVGGVVPIDGCDVPVLQDIGSTKIELLREILEQVPDGENVIIWCRFKHNLHAISALLKELGWAHSTFSGENTSAERKQIIEDFQAGKTRAFVGIINAGGHGLTLTRASYMVYFSQDYSIERRMQSEDRAHRIGQTKSVTYIDLVARQTLEESILKCLKGKKGEAALLFEINKDPGAYQKLLEGEL